MDTGIGKDGYSIIGQGRIDQLLSNKPQDRRMLFEEAAGIVRFKSRRDEANKELAEEQANLQRVQDVLNEASSRLEPLEKQAEEARKYLKISDELKICELQTFLKQVTLLDKQYQEAKEKADQLSDQLAEAQNKNEEAQLRLKTASEEAKQSADLLAQMLQKISDLRVSRENQDGEKKLHAQALSQLQRQVSVTRERLDEVVSRRERRSRAYAKEMAQIEEYRQTLEEQTKQQEKVEADRTQAEQSYEQMRKDWDSLYGRMEEAGQKVEELKNSLTRQQVLHEQDEGERENLKQQMEALQSEVDSKTESAKNARENLEQARKQYKEAADRVIALTDEISEIRAKAHEAGNEKLSADQKVSSLRSRIQWLKELDKEYEGYSSTVKVLMQYCSAHKSELCGVYGTVADLCDVPERYALPIEIALGAAVQNIVTDNQQTVRRLIDYLHEKKAGRATFQPLSDVTGRSVDQAGAILAMDGVLGFADQLISFEPRFKAVFSRLLGNVIVADTYEHAAAAARQYGRFLRVVTLRGDMFNIGGSITGGSISTRNASILSRKGELDTLRLSLQKAEENLNACIRKEQEIAELRRQKSQEMQEISQRRDQLSGMVGKIQSESDQAQLRLQMAAQQLMDQQKSSKEARENMEALQKGMAALQADYEASLKEQKELEAQAEENRKKREEARSRVDEAKSESMRLRIEVTTTQQLMNSLERTTAQERMDNLQDEESQKLYESQIQEDEERIRELEEEELNTQDQLETIRKELDTLYEQSHQQSLLKDQKAAEFEKAQKDAQDASAVVYDLEKEAYRLDGQESRAKKELTDLQDKIWEKYEITRRAAEEMNLPPIENAAAMNRRINELRGQLKALGPVNVHAVEEYAELKERCDFLSGQLEDVRSAEANLQSIIAGLTEQMEIQFREGFARISEQFNKVFAQMFNGGRGELRLEEESNPLESGIEIVAQPPGKTLKSMTALSGGERALTAIAILFAIQQLKPAPFCILDEIEAALDDANVDRYAHFLQSLSGTTKFIVITHRKGTMEAADTMYGITMEEKGVSRCVSVKFE